MVGVVRALDDCAVRVVDLATVESVRSALPDAEQVDGLGAMFALLADPGRLRLLTSLMHADELCVCDLAAACGMRESAVSHALRLLRAHRVVGVRRAGRMSYYRLHDGHVRQVLELGLRHLAEARDEH
jgi:DNA-binding transcriptional ArsR family regulator